VGETQRESKTPEPFREKTKKKRVKDNALPFTCEDGGGGKTIKRYPLRDAAKKKGKRRRSGSQEKEPRASSGNVVQPSREWEKKP